LTHTVDDAAAADDDDADDDALKFHFREVTLVTILIMAVPYELYELYD